MNDVHATGPAQDPPRSREGRPGIRGASSSPSLNADLALALCLHAFGPPSPAGRAPSLLAWLTPEWGGRLGLTIEHVDRTDRDAGLRILRDSHRAQACVDLSRVHPSWLDRAVREESPAVRRVLSGEQSGADPRIADWVRTLATERLVGGEPPAANDPPAIVALAGLSLRQLYRLARATGQAKASLAGLSRPESAGNRVKRDRGAWYRDVLPGRLGGDPATLAQWASREIQGALSPTAKPARIGALLGISTLARLLADCEPFRVRWALQHLPYPVAKRFRSLIPPPFGGLAQLRRLEEILLKTAWERLTLERRIDLPCPAEMPRTSDAS